MAIDILSKLASSQNRNDEELNIALAKKIASKNDSSAIKELVVLLQHKNRNIRNDAIKVMYEAGEANPKLAAPFLSQLMALLSHKDNRMVWGTMHAIDAITLEKPKEVFDSLRQVEKALDCGSVIARDHYVKILAKLSTLKKFSTETVPLLVEQIRSCPVNQLPMYAEYAAEVISSNEKNNFIKAIKSRWDDATEFPAKLKRLEKVLKKVERV